MAQSFSTKILKKCVDDWAENTYIKSLLQADDNSFHGSLINKVQLRSETNNFRFDQQEFAIRMGASSLSNLKNIRNLSDEFTKLHNAEALVLLMQRLVSNYNVIIELAYMQSRKTGLEILIGILTDQVKYFEKKLEQGETRWFEDFIDGVTELQTATDKLTELQITIEKNAKVIGYTEVDSNLRLANLISPLSQITFTRIRNWSQIINQHPAFVVAELKGSIQEYEDKISKGDQQRLLQFIQLRYRNDPEDILQERVNIGVGINIPYTHPDKYKLKLAAYENMLTRQKLEYSKLQKVASIEKTVSEYEILKKAYLNKELRMNEMTKSLENVIRISTQNGDWHNVLKINGTVNKMQLELQKDIKDLLEIYIKIIFESGAIIADPRINYLLEIDETF